MIEKWKDEKDWDSLYDWRQKVRLAIENYHTDKEFTGYLSWDVFEDTLSVMVENGDLKITLNENVYDTTDMRGSNVRVIMWFVEEELPYYEFYKQTDSPDSEHGFRLIFKLKEGF